MKPLPLRASLPPLTAERASAILDRFEGARVLVVGDLILDRFIVGSVTRISPEAPVPVVRFKTEYVRLGGAANVANNVAALGGDVQLVGLVGRDAAGDALRRTLVMAGIPSDGLVVDDGRCTTEKVRIVTERNQQVSRIDYEDDTDAAEPIEAQLLAECQRREGDVDVVLVSDYLKGAVTERLVASLVAGQRRNPVRRVPVVVDPKIPHLAFYAGASVVTPNQAEAEAATHRRIRQDDEARVVAEEFRARARCESVLVTRGEHGMWLSTPAMEGAIPAVTREVSDVTGAGDTVVAALALAIAAGATLPEAAVLANHAAGVVVGKFGPSTLSRDELLAALAHA